MFKLRSGGSGAKAPPPPTTIETLRRRSRQRLIGAVVLVLAGVIGLPLLFDTQPRPVPVDLAIQIPEREQMLPLSPLPPSAPVATAGSETPQPVLPAPAAPDAVRLPPAPETLRLPPAPDAVRLPPAPAPGTVEPTPAPAPAPNIVRLPPAPAPAAPVASARPPAATPAPPASAPASQPAPVRRPPPPPAAPAARSAAAIEASRAQAILNARSPAAQRLVVQIGAFEDPARVRQVRQRLERSGLSTYTQVAQTPDGPRTRVRLGPFATRAEAESAARQVRQLGLPASILVL